MAELNHSNLKKDIFPVGLLAAGRPCLVVGGGRIGLRKACLLLDADADVTVISPELHPELAALACSKLKHIARDFRPADVSGFFLVFAATSDRAVNKEVLHSCREHGVYGCSTDKTWPMGDFVTPATVRKDGITVAVSTGGKSCRRAKMIKDSFNRHLQMLEEADLLVLGTSHNYLSIHEREPYHLAGKRLQQAGEMLMQIWGVHEFSILNTCNRIELHAIASETPGVENIIARVLEFNTLRKDGFYIKRGYRAFTHMSVLTAGLLSQIPGEKHIVAQVKQAVTNATACGWAGAMMQQWHDAALHVSKDIRNETEGILNHNEIEDLCLSYLSSECSDWAERRIMVVGAGIIGQGLTAQLAAQGKSVQWCYHQQRPEIPAKYRNLLHLCSMNELREKLAQVDVIICATGGDGHLIHMGHAPFFDQESDTLIIDLAMPRNVEPKLNELGDTVTVIDLDDLKHWYRRKMADMARIFEISNSIVAGHKIMYDKLINSFQGGNVQK